MSGIGIKEARSCNFGPQKTVPHTAGTKPHNVSYFYTIFRLFARPEVKIILILIKCRQCGDFFCVCRECWKGQAYCCDSCKNLGYAKQRREAQRRYRKTEKGKAKHREAEKQRRLRFMPMAEKTKDEKDTKEKKQNKQAYNPALHNRQPKHTIKLGNEKIEKGYCQLCGATGVIVKRISQDKGEREEHYYSFRVKRRE